jgi:hypothetical protein
MAYQKLQASQAVPVTKSDTVLIPNPGSSDGNNNRGCVLYVGTTGNLKVLTAAGDTTTFIGVPGGTFFPVQVLQVFATGTTASNIIALW